MIQKPRHFSIAELKRVRGELTHIKCYRDGEVDEASADTLTHIHGYPNQEHEFISQTRVSGSPSRALSASRAAAQVTHPLGVLRDVRVSSQIGSAVVEPAAAHHPAQTERAKSHLRSGGSVAGAQSRLAGERPVVQQAAQGGAAGVVGTLRAARRAAGEAFKKKLCRSVPRRSIACCGPRAYSIRSGASRRPTPARSCGTPC